MLEIEDLSVHYGGIRALAGVSLVVPDGAATAVIGANGAGKSSLARAVLGLVPPSEGRIRFEGVDITHLSPEARTRLGVTLVPEGRGVIPGLTVEENLLVGGYLRRADMKEQLAFVHEMFPQLAPLKKRHARVLSGGELQLLALGRAVMMKPKLLIIDEPSMGLAPIAIGGVREALQRLRTTNMAMLLIEQNVNLAFDVCDDVYILSLGGVASHGTVGEISENEAVRHAYLGT